MKFYERRTKGEEEVVSYWLSIGDLMASILIIFILLFVFKTMEANSELKKKEDVIESLTSVKNKIIEKLRNEFKKENMKIDIDPINGAIKIDEKILFNTNEYKIKPEGKDYLKKFIPQYTKILIGDSEVNKEVSQIIIEGHTDDVGGYLFNMDLSQNRAFEVIKFIYEEMEDFQFKEELKNYITANGRSKMRLIKDTNGNIDREKSRRVEFQFKLREDEALKKIGESIKGGI